MQIKGYYAKELWNAQAAKGSGCVYIKRNKRKNSSTQVELEEYVAGQRHLWYKPGKLTRHMLILGLYISGKDYPTQVRAVRQMIKKAKEKRT